MISISQIFIIIIGLSLTGCTGKSSVAAKSTPIIAAAPEVITFRSLSRLSLIGDFNGDGNMDTLQEHCISVKTGHEIDSFPENNRDTLANYFHELQSKVFISSSLPGIKPLPLSEDGFSIGLFCLINMGNIDKKKGDEIALVVDYPDYSSLNTCRIFSLRNDHWQEIGAFNVFEGAFQYLGEEPRFDSIPKFLERKKGVWYYSDYLKNDGFMELTRLDLDSIRIPDVH